MRSTAGQGNERIGARVALSQSVYSVNPLYYQRRHDNQRHLRSILNDEYSGFTV